MKPLKKSLSFLLVLITLCSFPSLWSESIIAEDEKIKSEDSDREVFAYINDLAIFKENHLFGLLKNGEILHPATYEKIDYKRKTKSYIVWEKEKAGYINSKGVLVIPTHYESIYIRDNENIFVAKEKEKSFFLSALGEEITPESFDKTGYFSEGILPVQKNGLWGFINTQGEIVSPFIWKDSGYFSQGLAPVESREGKTYYVDTKGNILFESPLSSVNRSNFFHGVAPVFSENGKLCLIDMKGNVILKPQYGYEELSPFEEEGYICVNNGSRWGVINTKGEVVVPFIAFFESRISISEGKAMLQEEEDSSWLCYDLKTKEILFELEERGPWGPSFFSEGTFACKSIINGIEGYYLFNDRGEVILGPYLNCLPFSQGLAPVQGESQKWGFINKKGDWILPPKWDRAMSFENGIALVSLNGEGFYINVLGEVISPIL